MQTRTGTRGAPKRRIPAVIDPAHHDAMTRLARDHNRSVGGEYRHAVAEYLAAHEEGR